MTLNNNRHISLFALLFVLFVGVFSLSAAPKKNQPFVVVIDAGHGGKDVGAVDNGQREKDINLAVALEFGDMLKKRMKDVKVVYTRENDTFKTLQERADIANKAKGNLFISIHTNSLDANNPKRTSVEGASVYVLGLHKDENNMKVAQRENAVISLEDNFNEKYEGFDPRRDESYIIFEMAQKKNLSNSIMFAEEAERQLVKLGGRKSRGVHQAGFWVLWATAMPGALVEVDFICNPKSAEFIGSAKGQKKLAEALFKSVELYRKELKLAANKPKVKEVITVADDQSVTLEASKGSTKVKSAVPTMHASARKGSTPRRRRSNSARRVSESRDYETEFIAVNTHSEKSFSEGIVSEIVEEAPRQPEEVNVAQAKKGKKQKDKKSKKDRKVSPSKVKSSDNKRIINGKEVTVASATGVETPSRQTAKQGSERARTMSRARQKSQAPGEQSNTQRYAQSGKVSRTAEAGDSDDDNSDNKADAKELAKEQKRRDKELKAQREAEKKRQEELDKQAREEKRLAKEEEKKRDKEAKEAREHERQQARQAAKDVQHNTADSKVKHAFGTDRASRQTTSQQPSRQQSSTQTKKTAKENDRLSDPDNRLNSSSRSRHGSRN